MTPYEIVEAFAGIVTETVKRPFRDEPLTEEELDIISDRIVRLTDEEIEAIGREDDDG